MFLGEYSKAEPSSKPNISKKALLQKPSKDQNFHIELVQDQRVFWNPPFLYYSEISFARESEIGFSQFSHSLRHIKPSKKTRKYPPIGDLLFIHSFALSPAYTDDHVDQNSKKVWSGLVPRVLDRTAPTSYFRGGPQLK